MSVKVFHGSPNKFTEFDYSRIRTNGTTEGVGFYFTDNRKIAEGYGTGGYLYEVTLKGKRPLSNEELTLTRDEAEKVIKELDDRLDFLSNYGEVGFEGYDKVLARAIEGEYESADTDTDFIGSLYNSCGESEEVVRVFYDVLGYDHILTGAEWGGDQKLYIALTNDIIQIDKIVKL